MAQVRFTRRDLELLPEDGNRRELIDGDVFVAPTPTTRHQLIVGDFYFAIRTHLQAKPVGRVLVAPLDVMFDGGEDTVQPDLVYVSRERDGVVTQRGIEGSPDWVVEVLSPSNRDYDRKLKRKLYGRSGVAVYWVVDPENETIRAWEGDALTLYRVGEVARVSSLPGFTLALADLFG